MEFASVKCYASAYDYDAGKEGTDGSVERCESVDDATEFSGSEGSGDGRVRGVDGSGECSSGAVYE